MGLRNKLKQAKPTRDVTDVESGSWSETWSVGTDIPLSWSKKDLKQCHKNCLRANYKSGYLTKEQYKEQLRKL